MPNDPNRSARPVAVTVKETTPAQSIFEAQLELIAVMSQCTIEWATLPMKLAFPLETSKDAVVPKSRMDDDRAAAPASPAPAAPFAWLVEPAIIITGIADTVNDQAFKPRPRATQRELHTLWERSNEFQSGGDQKSRRDRAGRPFAA